MTVDAKLLDSDTLSRDDTETGFENEIATNGKFRKFISNAVSFIKTNKLFIIAAASFTLFLLLIILFALIFYESESTRKHKADVIDEFFAGRIFYNCYPNQILVNSEKYSAIREETVGQFIVRTLYEHGYVTYPEAEIENYNEFDIFMSKFKKIYYTTEEKSSKYMIFRENYQMIKDHNATPGVSFLMGVNQYSDKSQKEFKKALLNVSSFKIADLKPEFKSDNNFTLPASANTPDQFCWKPEVLGEVLDQGICGSCWAFATAGAVQANYNANFTPHVTLSPQELLDCDTRSFGCQGGDPLTAIEYIAANGLCSLSQYPYEEVQAKCREYKCKKKVFIKSWMKMDNNFDEALQFSPIVVVINGDGPFQHYSSGIFEGPCIGEYGNHAVLLVGYGVDKKTNKKYWIIKNSWGVHWGENGYVRILRSDDGNGPDCHFAQSGLIPQKPFLKA